MELGTSISLVGLLVAAQTVAQVAPAIEWERCFGGSGSDEAHSIVQTTEGGYILAGSTGSSDGDVSNYHGAGDYWVVKLDVTGNLEWEKNLGGSSNEEAFDVAQTSDGGFIVTGSSRSTDIDVSNNHGQEDYWVVKLGFDGSLQWERSLGGSLSDNARAIAQTSDGGYIVIGYSESTDGGVTNNHGASDYWLVKLDFAGNPQWQKSLGGSSYDEGKSIAQAGDGGYIVAGYAHSTEGNVTNNHGSEDYWVAKLDTTGSLQWEKSVGGSSADQASSIIQTSDGGYVVTGITLSTNGEVSNNHGFVDCWVVKLEGTGGLLWQKCLGGSSHEFARSITQASDGGYILAGYTHSTDGDISNNHGQNDFWVVKLDDEGNIQWEKTIGGSYFDDAYSIAQTIDGGYILAGYTESTDVDVSTNHGASDFWVVKLAPEGVGINEQALTEFTCSPNPAHGVVRVTTQQAVRNTRLSLTDALGREVLHAPMNGTSVDLDLQATPAGLYLLTGLGDQGVVSQRLVVE